MGVPETARKIDVKKGAQREASEPQNQAFRVREASKSGKVTGSEKIPKKRSKRWTQMSKTPPKPFPNPSQQSVVQRPLRAVSRRCRVGTCGVDREGATGIDFESTTGLNGDASARVVGGYPCASLWFSLLLNFYI